MRVIYLQILQVSQDGPKILDSSGSLGQTDVTKWTVSDFFFGNMTHLYRSWQKLNLAYPQNGMFLNLIHAFEAQFHTITFFFLVLTTFEIFISINIPRRSMLIPFLLLQTMLAVESAMLKPLRNQKYQFFVEPKFLKINTDQA